MRVRSISGSFEGGCGEGGRDGWPRGETAGDGAEGDFLGGTRSPRPLCEAASEPRHNMIIGGKGTPGGLAGTCLGQARALLAGVRSPPLRGGAKPRGRGLAGKCRR